MITTYDLAYAKSQDPNRGRADIKAKDVARDNLKTSVRQYVKEHLEYSSAISDEERERMGLPVHKTTRTPAKVADEAPYSEVDTSVAGRITVHFFEKGDKHKKSKPQGQMGVELVYIISDTPPQKWEDMPNSVIDTNSPVHLDFENDVRSKTLFYSLRWINTRGIPGPWSTIQSVIIP
jgi:hypothetical protein